MYEMKPDNATNEDPQSWLKLIEDMVDSGEFDWAEETLLGIGETIENSGRVTPGQIEAIENIRYA